jgi:hypothetical protein
MHANDRSWRPRCSHAHERPEFAATGLNLGPALQPRSRTTGVCGHASEPRAGVAATLTNDRSLRPRSISTGDLSPGQAHRPVSRLQGFKSWASGREIAEGQWLDRRRLFPYVRRSWFRSLRVAAAKPCGPMGWCSGPMGWCHGTRWAGAPGLARAGAGGHAPAADQEGERSSLGVFRGLPGRRTLSRLQPL